jgi:hypothetical protein
MASLRRFDRRTLRKTVGAPVDIEPKWNDHNKIDIPGHGIFSRKIAAKLKSSRKKCGTIPK